MVDTLVKALAYLLQGQPANDKWQNLPRTHFLQKTNSNFSPRFNGIPLFSLAFQDCSTYNNKALTRHTMPQVSEQSWLFNTHTILVFLCRRAVVLVALLLYNGPHSGFSEWQQAERKDGPGPWLPLPFVYLTHTQIHVIVCTHIFSNPFMRHRQGGGETVYDITSMFQDLKGWNHLQHHSLEPLLIVV